MRAFLHDQFRTFRSHGKILTIILIVTQMAVIGLMLLANKNLHALYDESIKDNVKLFIENYQLRLKIINSCPPTEQEQEQEQETPLPVPKGVTRV